MKRRYLVSSLSAIALMASSTSSAYAVKFTPPDDNRIPSQATGGASRGLFIPDKNNSAPSKARAGSSRGNLFTPQEGNSAPRQAGAGSSRGNLFTPEKGNSAPRQAGAGSSRGNLFTPEKGNSAPRQSSAAGASRLGIYPLDPSIVAATGPAALVGLMPQSYYGTTVSERPTIMVYLPPSNAKKAAFSIKDEAGNTHYKMTVPVAGRYGVIAIKLPSDAPALAENKNYQWFLALKVDGKLSPSTPYIDGWIKRIQPNAELKTAMQQQDVLKQAKAFGKHGVWYDCVAKLASLHTQQPDNATIGKQWKELLSSVDLKEIAMAPVVSGN
ncbi:MAG: DUF928 domain-containing protein [Calothrix sp. MO_167.B12]|nr:DUF928 domain-containing protein [Calothrix sp. MO_167.B12]